MFDYNVEPVIPKSRYEFRNDCVNLNFFPVIFDKEGSDAIKFLGENEQGTALFSF